MSDERPGDLSDAPEVPLPNMAGRIARDRPDVWKAFQRLGHATSDAGPLDEKAKRLVNLALAIGADSEGATHSHVRRALSEGLSGEELEHVAYLAITTLGWPRAARGLAWIRDVTEGSRKTRG
jgi:alkylhydroperoxidase/carboxymuconolactone decarboxylase family protein YurZ